MAKRRQGYPLDVLPGRASFLFICYNVAFFRRKVLIMPQTYDSVHRARQYREPGPFPMHVIKRVDRPTSRVYEPEIKRVDERDGGFQRAGRGEYGAFLQHEYHRFVEKHPLSLAQRNMGMQLAKWVDGSLEMAPAPNLDDPAALARHIKETAYFLRADAVGICELPPYAVFTNSRWNGKPIECTHKYAIAILVYQDWRTAQAFNGRDWISNSMSFLAYTTSGFIACLLADYIRQLGFPARAHHAMNYQVLVPPILLWAGLGEMCRIGDMVIHPFLGPRFKAAIVTTDLPMAVDKPIDFGLQDFCDKCRKCARECPSQAISHGDKVMHNGYEKWPIDVQKCTAMRVGNQYGSGCGTCIKVCPWNKPFAPFHRAVNWCMRKFPLARGFAVKADDMMGYGKPKAEEKWWLDLEISEGKWNIPTEK
jgi:reductive dehalogenase